MFASLNSWVRPGTILQAESPEEILRGGPKDWPKLREALAQRQGTKTDSLHPHGAAIGMIGYEGEFQFGFFPEIHVIPEQGFSSRWDRQRAHWDQFCTDLNQDQEISWRSNQKQSQFEERVKKAQDYIAAGDVYQVNLAQKFTTSFSGNPYRLFEQVLGRSPAPGGAFLDLSTGPEDPQGWQVLSASPELFLQIQGRHIMTRPIKGTRPRSRDPMQDEQNAFELITNGKELAELIMITDLERNDLGRICDYGTVAVTQLVQLERFAQVFHLVSTVEGQLQQGIDALEAIRLCLPGGSISGAPKKRACEIIAELEPCPRGYYTGALGYIDYNGDAVFSIIIRTLFHLPANMELNFSVGSGITAGSVPPQEYEETLHKASGLRQAVEAYQKQKINVKR